MDEINEKNVKKPDENQIINKFGNLVAVSAIASKSPSLMDRLSHALSPNIILETIYECLRIYNSGIRSGDIIILKREKIRMIIRIRIQGSMHISLLKQILKTRRRQPELIITFQGPRTLKTF